MTNDVVRRAWEHRQGTGSGFTARHRLHRLVYAEPHDDISRAIHRETRLKHRLRRWKLNLIEQQHPLWEDLYEQLTA